MLFAAVSVNGHGVYIVGAQTSLGLRNYSLAHPPERFFGLLHSGSEEIPPRILPCVVGPIRGSDASWSNLPVSLWPICLDRQPSTHVQGCYWNRTGFGEGLVNCMGGQLSYQTHKPGAPSEIGVTPMLMKYRYPSPTGPREFRMPQRRVWLVPHAWAAVSDGLNRVSGLWRVRLCVRPPPSLREEGNSLRFL